MLIKVKDLIFQISDVLNTDIVKVGDIVYIDLFSKEPIAAVILMVGKIDIRFTMRGLTCTIGKKVFYDILKRNKSHNVHINCSWE